MFKVNIHEFKTNKNIDFKLCLISDIHYSEKFDSKLEEKIIKEIKNNKPDYILLAGDIIDTYPFFDKKENINRLKGFIERISSITKTFIIFGSHDLEDVKKPILDFNKNISYWKQMFKDNKNIYILDNINYSDAKVNIMGITLPGIYYNGRKIEDSLILKDLLMKNIKPVKNKYNILLVHSPRRIIKNINYLDNIDLVLCGHMHDGGVPKFLKWLPGSRGIIGPRLTFFPKYARGIIKKNNLCMLVSGGITKFAPSHLKRIKFINRFYNNEMEIINIRGKYE